MLTTRCPYCHTAFRIRPEQLSVRGGRVRCGHCQQAFSALEQLEDVDEEDLTPAPFTPPRSATPHSSSSPRTPAGTPASSQMASANKPKPLEIRKPPSAAVKEETPPIPSALFTASGLPPLRPSTPAKPETPTQTIPPRAKGPTLSKFPDVPGSSLPPAMSTRPNSPSHLSEMPVPNAIAHDEVSKITSWDQFQIPVDIEELDDESHISSGKSPAKDSREQGTLNSGSSKEHKEPTLRSAPVDDEEEFSMSIVLDGETLPVNTPHDPDFDKKDSAPAQTEPYRSEIAKQLGIPPYSPESGSQSLGQTVMLEEPVEIGHTQMDEGPESLFDERERQQRQKEGHGREIEDRRHKQSGGYIWMLGALGMLVVFVILTSYLLRTELARAVPTLRPTLETACSWVGCTVPFPRDADQIVVEGHSFNPEDGQEDGKYRLVVTLLNKAAYEQAWPDLELTVTDRFDIAIARRVLKPAEWLPQANRNQLSFKAHTEITANLPITLNNVQASGYRLYVFYP